jgi:hypothetical protein
MMMLSEQELKIYVQRNQHLNDYPAKIIQSSYLKARDQVFLTEFELRTADKRTKHYSELQKNIAFNKAIMPQLEEAFKILTGREIIKY